MHDDEYAKMFSVEDTHWWFAGKRRLVSVLLKKLPLQSERKTLDAGCGTGGMLPLLDQYTSSGELFGVDVSRSAIDYSARRRLAQLTRASLLHLPFRDSSLDLVTAFDVLYHRRVEDDRIALREIARVLKPRGYVVITDSALEFLRSGHDERFHGVRRYTTQEMKDKIEDAGFTVKKISYTNFLIFPMVAVWRLARRQVSAEKASDVHAAPKWLNRLMSGVYCIEAAMLRRVNLPIGSSIIVLAERR